MDQKISDGFQRSLPFAEMVNDITEPRKYQRLERREGLLEVFMKSRVGWQEHDGLLIPSHQFVFSSSIDDCASPVPGTWPSCISS